MKIFTINLLTFTLLLLSCQSSPEKRYLKLEAQELATNTRQDSLFKGVYLGMKEAEFYDFCLTKNIHKDFFQGGQKDGSWICTKIKDSTNKSVEINFFPEFKQGKIFAVNTAFYDGNLLDNNKESLGLKNTLLRLEKWYGKAFIKIESPYFFKNDVYVSVHGNRRIIVSKEPQNNFVDVRFVDLLALKQ